MRRSGKILIGGLAAMAVLAVVLYAARAPVAAWVVMRLIAAQGFGPVSVAVTDFDTRGLKLKNLSAADGAIKATQVDLSYTLGDLLQGRIGDVTVAGLSAAATYDEAGLRLGNVKLFPRDSAATAQLTLPFRNLGVPGAAFDIALPDGSVRGTMDVGLAESGEGMDVTFQISARGDRATADAQWAGRLDLSGPPTLRGKGGLSFEITGRRLPALVQRLSARGAATVDSTQGALSVNSAGPIALGLSGFDPALTARLPVQVQTFAAAWLRDGLSFVITGSKGRPTFIMSTAEGVITHRADVEVAAVSGKASARAVLRGAFSSLAGGVLRDMKLDVLSADLTNARLPFAFAPSPVTARLRLTRVGGSLASAGADLAVTANTPRLATDYAVAEAVAASATAQLRLEGGKLELIPTTARLVASNAASPGAAPPWRIPGQITADLALPAPPSVLVVDFSAPGGPAVRFDVNAVSRPLTVETAALQSMTLNLSRVRVHGDATAARWDANLVVTDGVLEHSAFTLDRISVDGRMDGQNIEGKAALRLARFGSGGADSVAFAKGAVSPGLHLESRFLMNADKAEISADVNAASGPRVGQARITAAPDFSRGNASVDIAKLTFGNGITLASILSSAVPITAVSGAADLAVRAAWKGGRVTQSAKVLVKDIGLSVGSLTVERLNAALELDQIWPPRSAKPQILSAAVLTAGLPFTNLEAEIELRGDSVAHVRRSSLALAGGRITGNDLVLPLDGSPSQFTLSVGGVDAAALAALVEVDGLTVTGTLAGEIPLRIADGDIRVNNAALRAVAPGHIAYRPAESPAGLASAESGVLLLKALANFQYDSLALSIDGSAISEVTAGLALKGRNPDLYGGYPIEFNLNLGGKLTEILRRGLVGYRIPAEVQERMKQFNLPPAPANPIPATPTPQ